MVFEDKHIKKIAEGNKKVFQYFFEAFYPSLCKFCYDFINSTEIAADLAQDAMIKFWSSRESHTSVKQAKVYLYTIAKNDCINYIKHNQVVENHKSRYAENKEFITNAYIEDEVFDILRIAITKLPPQTKKIISLALNGYRNNQIAEELDISINTVKTLKKSAYSTLRQLLKGRIFLLFLLMHEE